MSRHEGWSIGHRCSPRGTSQMPSVSESDDCTVKASPGVAKVQFSTGLPAAIVTLVTSSAGAAWTDEVAKPIRLSRADVIDAIAAVKTGRKRGHDDVPLEPVTVHAARRVAAG